MQVGKSTVNQRTNEVQSQRGTFVPLDQAPRVGGSVFEGKRGPVDIVTAVARQFDPILGLGVLGPWFGVLTSKASHSDHGTAGAVHHDQ